MSIRLLTGDCRDVLPTLASHTVRCCVTSPPYFGLRDYGTGEWNGGDPTCDHRHETAHQQQGTSSQRSGRTNADAQRNENFRDVCGKCGARRVDHQVGLESSVDAYVAALVDVFRAVRRVLTDDGTLFLVIGDSYFGGGGYSPNSPSNIAGSRQSTNKGSIKGRTQPVEHADARHAGACDTKACGLAYPDYATPSRLKPKDLIGIPWRVAFALQADGWYLRQDIIWHKPNPMPESVRDRCTKSHEYLFLLSKSARYYYDAAAIAEQSLNAGREIAYDGDQKNIVAASDKRMRTRIASNRVVTETRNKRSVWTVATQPFSGAHFATFPPALIEPCIKAASQEGDTVLDPFSGAGTVGLVSSRLGRNYIGIELNPEYVAMSEQRIRADAPLFAEVSHA